MVTRPRNLQQADPYFDSVVLLCPFSGEDGDTTSTDLSNDVNALTFNGSAALDGDIRKFGFTSFACDGAVTFSAQPLVDAGMASGDFTVEFWYRPDGTASINDRLFQTRNGDLVSGIYIAHEQFNADQIGFGYDVNGSTPWDYLSSGVSVTNNVWQHIALVRNGSSWNLYLNGTSVLSTTYAGSIYLSGSDTCVIGAQTVGSTRANGGWIEDFRITSVARYTANFTPPERAYPVKRTHSPVKNGLILHLDPANPECFSSGATTATNLITGGSVTGASGNPNAGAHTPNAANMPAYSSLNGGIFDFAGGRGMNVEEDLGSHTAMSLEMWYYKNSAATTQYFADARNDGGQWFLTNYTSFNITWQSNATYNFDTTYDGANTDFINRWQHLIMTSDATGSKLYIDGTERTLVTSNSLVETFGVNYRIGTRYTTSGQWTGYMGPIRLYNRVLSFDEVRQNFNAQKFRFGL